MNADQNNPEKSLNTHLDNVGEEHAQILKLHNGKVLVQKYKGTVVYQEVMTKAVWYALRERGAISLRDHGSVTILTINRIPQGWAVDSLYCRTNIPSGTDRFSLMSDTEMRELKVMKQEIAQYPLSEAYQCYTLTTDQVKQFEQDNLNT